MSVCPLCFEAGATVVVRIFGIHGTRTMHEKCKDVLEGLGLPTQRVEPPPPRKPVLRPEAKA